ncbi:MAG: hypothetical protein ACE5I2_16735, partial [Anaerolineae bacterium]
MRGKFLIVLVVLSMVVASCAPKATPTPTPKPVAATPKPVPATATPVAKPPTPEVFACTDDIGCVDIAPD